MTTRGDPTEDGWAAQGNPMKRAAARANYYSKRSSNKEPTDSLFPDPLKNIKYWNTFSKSLEAYLQGKRGVTMVSLLYVIRSKSEETVSQANRDGEVGLGKIYPDWDDHGRRCTVLEGEHYQTDSKAVWSIISKLVRDGPG